MWWLKLAQVGKKYWQHIAIVAATVGVLSWVYDMGGDNREASIRAQMAEQAQADVDSLAAYYEKRLLEQSESNDRALEASRNEREIITKTETVTKYVDVIKVPDHCVNFAADTVLLLHDITSIGVATTGAEAGAD